MHKNKLIQYLEHLDRKEMTRFREFVESPYFNKHDQVRSLVQYLSSIYPRFDAKRCNRKVVYREVFGKENFDASRLAPVLTYTQRLLEEFLAQEQYTQRTDNRHLHLLYGLRCREMYREFEKQLEKVQVRKKEIMNHSPEVYYYKYCLAKEADDYFNRIDRRRVDTSLETKQHHLDIFFLMEKLRDACEFLVRRRIMRVAYKPRFLDYLLEEIRQDPGAYSAYPGVLLFYKIYRMLRFENEQDYYFEALEYFESCINDFDRQQLIEIYNYFMNFCIGRINAEDPIFLQEIFKLYQAQLRQGLLMEDGYLSEWDYKNIVTTGIRLREMEWVESFLSDYKEALHPEVQDNAYHFNLASFYYASGQLDKVLDLLIKVEYSDLRYNLGAKVLLLRTYYDLDEYEALQSLTESFRQYLLRNKLMSDGRRTGYKNLFNLTRRAAHLRTKMNYLAPERASKEIEKLIKDINETEDVYIRSWLLEKVEEMSD